MKKENIIFCIRFIKYLIIYASIKNKFENGYTFAPLGEKILPLFYIKVHIKYKQNI